MTGVTGLRAKEQPFAEAGLFHGEDRAAIERNAEMELGIEGKGTERTDYP